MIARVLLSVAAIAVPLFIALVVQRFFALRQQQIPRIEEFGRSQDRLRDYRQAIGSLGWELHSAARANGIELDFKTPFSEQRTAEGFWDDPNVSTKIYIHAFHDFGDGSYRQPEYRHTERLIHPEEFERLYQALEQCSGFFARRKYYGPVLDSLGIVEQQRWDETYLCTERVTYDVPQTLQKGADDVRTMEFWVRTVDEAQGLMLEMGPALRTLLSPYPSGMLFYSVAQGVLGILVPLGVLAIKMPPVAGFYTTYSTLALFLAALTASLTGLWRYVRAPLLRL